MAASMLLEWACMLLLLLAVVEVEVKCRFPKDWKGRWYQSGLGDVIIRSNQIQRKGTCVEHHKDYWLMENVDEGCYQCLLMMKRHRNIIQYKESYCMGGGAMRSLCQHIRVEATLFTLVREPTTPIPPPFTDAYKVDYNDGMYPFCSDPVSHLPTPESTAIPCAGQDRINFSFKHCHAGAMWNGAELSFEVLAVWKELSETYMYGKFSGDAIFRKDDSYRCFKYEEYGHLEIYLAMSADATCRGLGSARDGPITMKLIKDAMGKPEPMCQFPSWMQRRWSDLAGGYIYSLNEAGSTFSTLRHWEAELVGGDEDELQSQIGCLEVHEDRHHGEVIVSGFSTHDCDIQYQCIKIRQLPNNVIALYKGDMSGELKDIHHCRRQLAHTPEYLILTDASAPPLPTPCPLRGQYHITGVSEDCDAHFDVGCSHNGSGDGKSTIDVNLSCSPAPERLSCLTSWEEENNIFLIIAKQQFDQTVLNCWIFTSGTDGRVRLDMETCNNGGIPVITIATPRQHMQRTECPNTQPSAQPEPEEEKEAERIIIDGRDPPIFKPGGDSIHPPNDQPSKPPDTAQPADTADNTADYSVQGGESKPRQDRTENSGGSHGMYRTSAASFSQSHSAVLFWVGIVVGQTFVTRICCR